MNNVFSSIEESGIIPVISLSNPDQAVNFADSLIAGGINNLEITLRNANALSCIEKIKTNRPELTVSAGTVLNTKSVDDAISAGADYLKIKSSAPVPRTSKIQTA